MGEVPIWNQVKFIDHNLQLTILAVKKTIRVRRYTININRVNKIKILEKIEACK